MTYNLYMNYRIVNTYGKKITLYISLTNINKLDVALCIPHHNCLLDN